MTMHQGIDLSRFKKIHDDGQTVTLRHSGGHELKIAHKGLSPKIKEHLKRIPFAEGGKAEKNYHDAASSSSSSNETNPYDKRHLGFDPDVGVPQMSVDPKYQTTNPQWGDQTATTLGGKPIGIADMDNQSPEGVDDQQPSSANVPDMYPETPAAATQGQPSLATPTPMMPENAPFPTGRPPKPEVMPQAGEVVVTGERKREPFVSPGPGPYNLNLPEYQAQKVADLNQLNNEASMYQQDLERGTIHPKTMADLYNQGDSVLGKIGTLFGLLISGAGSGLSHQPNAVLAMMERELDRDLDAQKASKSNVMNWYRLSQQHLINQAEINYKNAQTKLTEADVDYKKLLGTAIPSEIAQREAAAAKTKAETEGLLPAQIQEAQARVKQAEADYNSKAYDLWRRGYVLKKAYPNDPDVDAHTRNMMDIHAVDHLQKNVVNPAQGPVKQQAQSFLDNVVKPSVAAKVNERNTKAVADKYNQMSNPDVQKQMMTGQLSPSPEKYAANVAAQVKPGQSYVNQQIMDDILQKSRQFRSKEFEGLAPEVAPGIPSLSEPEEKEFKDAVSNLNGNRFLANKYAENFKKLMDMTRLGRVVDRAKYDALTASMTAEMQKEALGRFNMPESKILGPSMWPSWNEFGDSAQEKYEQQLSKFKQGELNPILERYKPLGLTSPFPPIRPPEQFLKHVKGTNDYAIKDLKTGKWHKVETP